MIIAQITDTHVLAEGGKVAGLVDTNAQLEAAVRHVNGLSTPPDRVLVTGDLVEDGTPEAYAALRARLSALRVPFHVIPGNHDRRRALVEAFSDHDYLPKSGFLHYAIAADGVRIVGLDTLLEGRDDGALCEERLAWLDATLAAAPDEPTLIAMHHPPFESGIWWIDAMGLSGATGFRAVIARHSRVRLIICGHDHRPICAAVAGVRVVAAPSAAWQFHLDLVPETRPHVALEPAAVLLHVFDGDDFVTHTSYVAPEAEAVDVSQMMGEWPEVRARLRAQKAALG